jgi:cytochrome c oxidase subunit 2
MGGFVAFPLIMIDTFIEGFKHGFLQLPVLASEHGRDVDNLLTYVHWLMLVLFMGWSAFFLYTILRFRRARHPQASYTGMRSHFSNYLEVGVALVEAMLLVGFAIPLWAKVVASPPPAEDATVIRIMGRQFNWVAHYAGVDGEMGRQDRALSNAADPFGVDRKNDPKAADDVVVQGNIVVPVNKPVLAQITSLDVIHSFAIKSMRVCQDAIPGMSIPTWFTPVKEGEYKITCAQLCGNSHFGMFGILKVVSPEEFNRWLAEQSGKAKAASAGPVNYE